MKLRELSSQENNLVSDGRKGNQRSQTLAYHVFFLFDHASLADFCLSRAIHDPKRHCKGSYMKSSGSDIFTVHQSPRVSPALTARPRQGRRAVEASSTHHRDYDSSFDSPTLRKPRHVPLR